ncbi:MAG: site-specific DNA-methyltransferase [Bacteroidales bacterium]|nr:site-specific DNA-methyltransferase [Bacteroidales bacterium]
MTEQEENLQIRIRELEKEIARLHTQIKEQRYGLTWLDVPEAFETESENKIPILEEVKDKAIDEGGKTPPHIIIEGDNYHALTCLNYTHRGRIDVIYIDPPYNTGSDGFTYKDKRFLKEFPDGSPVPKEHPLRHSYWLSFMSKRLELAKNLLSDKGVIFISIDDNEQANLKLLCDKVFGEDNFVGNYIWRKKYGGGQAVDYFSTEHEYIAVYRKTDKMYWQDEVIERSSKEFTHKDENGLYKTTKLAKWGNTARREDRPTMYFPIIAPDNTECYPIAPDGNDGRWRIGKNKMNQLIEANLIKWEKKGGKWIPYEKEYFYGQQKTIKDRSILYEVAETGDGSNVLTDIFGTKDRFLNPKPVEILSKIIRKVSNNNLEFTILDFFAGSGTTLHAVMKLNAEDGGNRQCILVQQREGDNNICENVTYERNRRVMCGYTNAKGEQVEGLGGRLKYYKSAFVGKNPSKSATDDDRVELAQKAGCLLALGENTLDEITSTNLYQIFADCERKKYTAIFFTEEYMKLPEFVAEVEKLQSSGGEIAVYIFSWGQPDIFENEFNSLDGISLKAIPQPILDVYKSLNQ